MRAGRGNDAALPLAGKGRCECAYSTLFAPWGQKRCRAARRMWVCRGKKRFPQAHCPSGGFAGAPGKAKPFVPFSVEDTAHPPFSSAHERRKVRRPASPAAAFFPCLPAGRPAGSARTRPRDQSLGNPFLGGPASPFPRLPGPQNAAGGRPLLVGLPPSIPAFAPTGTKRRTPAPCSWGGRSSTPSQRRCQPALPAASASSAAWSWASVCASGAW